MLGHSVKTANKRTDYEWAVREMAWLGRGLWMQQTI